MKNPPRPAHSYRAARRNGKFGRKAKGNTKPQDKEFVWTEFHTKQQSDTRRW